MVTALIVYCRFILRIVGIHWDIRGVNARILTLYLVSDATWVCRGLGWLLPSLVVDGSFLFPWVWKSQRSLWQPHKFTLIVLIQPAGQILLLKQGFITEVCWPRHLLIFDLSRLLIFRGWLRRSYMALGGLLIEAIESHFDFLSLCIHLLRFHFVVRLFF